MIAAAVAALLAWTYLLLLHGRFWQAGPMLAPARPERAPAVDVVIPARNEAEGIEAAVRSLLAQDYTGALRIIVVDDRSTDGTGDIARAISDERLAVITGVERPAGWSGKLWAVEQGVARSSAGLVLLTDADILHEPAHVATLVAKAERDGLDLVSEMVALRAVSLAERALVPAFVFFFQLLYPLRAGKRSGPADCRGSRRDDAGAAGCAGPDRRHCEPAGGADRRRDAGSADQARRPDLFGS